MLEDGELLAQGQDLELHCGPVLGSTKEHPEQRNQGSSRAVQVTLTKAKRSTIPGLTEFLGGTTYSRLRNAITTSAD